MQDARNNPDKYPLDPSARAFSAEQERTIEQLSEPMCVCGDPENVHIDGSEQCCIPECGCTEFENAATP